MKRYVIIHSFVSAGVTSFFLCLLIVFLLLCGFTHKTPPDPPAEEMVVEVQEIELEDVSGGGNMMDGGNYNPNNPKPAPEVKETPSKTSQNNNTPTTNTATSPTGPKANVPEQPKPNSNAMFGSDKVGSGQTPSTAGGTTSGNGGANGHGDGLGLGNDAGSVGGTGGGTGGGNKGKWVKSPDFSSLSDDKVYDIKLKCTIDPAGNVTEVNVLQNGGASLSLLNKVCEVMKMEAKYSSGHAGTITVAVRVGRGK